MLECYTALAFVAGRTTTLRLRAAGHRRDVPPPRDPGQDDDDARRRLARSSRARHRGRVVRARAPRPRRALPADRPSASSGWRRRSRSASRCGATTTGLTAGSHYQLAETICSPMPVSSPRPRIMIGGSGERKTLRLVAQYADACNIFGGTGRSRAQARRPAPALRRNRARSERDRSHRDVPRPPGGRDHRRRRARRGGVRKGGRVDTLVTSVVGRRPRDGSSRRSDRWSSACGRSNLHPGEGGRPRRMVTPWMSSASATEGPHRVVRPLRRRPRAGTCRSATRRRC